MQDRFPQGLIVSHPVARQRERHLDTVRTVTYLFKYHTMVGGQTRTELFLTGFCYLYDDDDVSSSSSSLLKCCCCCTNMWKVFPTYSLSRYCNQIFWWQTFNKNLFKNKHPDVKLVFSSFRNNYYKNQNFLKFSSPKVDICGTYEVLNVKIKIFILVSQQKELVQPKRAWSFPHGLQQKTEKNEDDPNSDYLLFYCLLFY